MINESFAEKTKPFDLLALGEVLLRLSPTANERLTRGDIFEKQVGGAEINVLSGVSLLGLHTGIISKLPANAIGTYVKNKIRFNGVSDDYLVYDAEKDARLGLYYYENGAYPRKPNVIYDREHTSIRKIQLTDYEESLFSSSRCFHTSGITLALNENTRRTGKEMIQKFKEQGTLISFDVNFRSNLWTGEEARQCIEQLLPMVDIFFCSEDTARLTFHKTGSLHKMMKEFADEYQISVVASTQRTVHSPRVHTFTSVIYSAANDCFYEEEPYHNIEVVDRIGSGDAYVSGVLYGLLSSPDDYKRALQFGNACSALKNTIPGDLPSSNLEEVLETIQAHGQNGYGAEMKR